MQTAKDLARFSPAVNNTLVRYGLPSQPKQLIDAAVNARKKELLKEEQERARRRKARRSRVKASRKASRH